MIAATIIDAVVTQSGTDASRPTLLNILNERYFEQVARSQWNQQTAPIATTVAGQSSYSIVPVFPAPPTGFAIPEFVEITGLKVAGYPWDRVGQEDMAYLRAGTVSATVGRGGLFTPDYDASGNPAIILYPTPTASGSVIEAIGACVPPILWDSPPPVGGAFVPITPSDMHGSLIDGVTSTVLRRIDERPDLAVPFETTFQAATEELRKRKNRLVRGYAPTQIQVAGYHFSNR